MAMEEEAEVRLLLERSGSRPEVPPEDLAAIKRAFRAEWQEHLRRRQARRFSLPGRLHLDRRSWDRRLWAVAAVLLAALGIGWWLWSLGSPAAGGIVARVEAAAGVVTVRAPHDDGDAAAARLAVGATIRAGSELETGGPGEGAATHAALRLTDGTSLRLDAGSRVRLTSASVVGLERGAVYVDSGREPGSGESRRRAVAVRTPLGVATDVGTQFEVRLLDEETMRVRVREGEVRIEGAGGSEASFTAVAGVELTLHADGSVTRERVAGHGSPWGWAVTAAPPFEIEGRRLEEFLDWLGHETGWKIRYADSQLEAQAGPSVLHGAVGHLSPHEATGVVLAGAGLEHEVVDGVLVIRAAGAPRQR